MTLRKGEKMTISIQEHMAIDVCPGPIKPIKQISDYFPRFPRGIPTTVTRSNSLKSNVSQPSVSPSESSKEEEEDVDKLFGAYGAASTTTTTSTLPSKHEEEVDLDGYDSDDCSKLHGYYFHMLVDRWDYVHVT
ncbi:hypothetical protein GDO81_005729 [Engystomops pustulosus]|uniref:Uncharacterized protein n=1 Tax=Engystomops pustulosus TaxID=76066 RepID=A0AAV7CR77_ENGPU|nr:hypothetical protein GDO81_005729 [Engystomops pustulosus]